MPVLSKVFTVSEIIRDTRASLEAMYPFIAIEGEISNLNRHSSGHCYFTLKDAGAQLSAVLFRDDVLRLRFQPESGLQVIVQGRLTIYPPQGRFQLVGSSMEPKGKGSLQLAFEQLKAKLEKEGLFAQQRKRAIPALPAAIGIVSSQDGAALHDILTVLYRRSAGLRVIVCHARVQGEGAAYEISEAINRLNKTHPELDTLLVGRGGGSIEDLWAFNEEIVARAIGASRIPVISCVGHETDFTIADFVADLRAPTPSAAAELVSRGRAEIRQEIETLLDRLRQQMHYQLDDLGSRLERAQTSRMLQRPDALLDERRQDVDLLAARLSQLAKHRTAAWEKDLAHQLQKLHLLSPLATLSRGYAVARALPDLQILKDARNVKPHDRIQVQLHEGRLYAEIERTEL